MQMKKYAKSTLLALFAGVLVAMAGCDKDDDNGRVRQGTSDQADTGDDAKGGDKSLAADRLPVPVEELEPPDDSACRGLEVTEVETEFDEGGIAIRQEVVKLPNGNLVAHGKTVHYWPNGEKKLEYHNVCGVRHGPKRAWHSSGDKWQEGAYAHNSDHGVWQEWYPGGQLTRRWTMIRGAWNGLYTEWYPNGNKRREVRWVNGQKQGAENVWSEDGSQVKTTEFVDGVAQP